MADLPLSQARTCGAVIVAAGQGTRAGMGSPKQFASWRGKPVVRHAAECLLTAGIAPVVVVIAAGAHEEAAAILADLAVSLTTGGATRQASVRAGLEALAGADPPERMLIHDAARPDCPPEVIARLVAALDQHSGAIPVLPVIDSLVEADGALMAGTAERTTLRRVQTPQAFRFADILAAHRAWTGAPNAGDDAQVLRAAGYAVALVHGDERLRKLTFASDFYADDDAQIPPAPAPGPSIRTGLGYDVHRLVPGERLWLCGILIEHERGLAGHSDADVVLHAITDAILGAAGQGDIGQHFPPSDPQWRGTPSARFVEHAVMLASHMGYQVANVDCTIICEAPKIGPYRAAMRARLAQLLGIGVERVNIKATTTERLGFAGRGEGIAAQAVATLAANR